jgi:hypothetical protein
MNAFGWRSDAEDESGSAVDVVKREPEFTTGIFRIDRLVRIEARLSRSKFPQVSHVISGGLAFLSGRLSLTNFSMARGN